MVLILDRQSFPTAAPAPSPAQRRRALGRALSRLGFPPALAQPAFDAPPPLRPTRRRDAVTSDWQPL